MKTKPKLYLIKTISLLLIFTTLFAGCSSTIVKMEGETTEQYHKRINELCKEESNFTILTIEGKEYSADKINLTLDSLSYIEYNTDSLCNFSSNEIKHIQTQENFLISGLYGILYSLAIPVLLCLIGSGPFPGIIEYSGLAAFLGFSIGIFSTELTTIIIN